MIVEIIHELDMLVDKVPDTQEPLERIGNEILCVQLLIEFASRYTRGEHYGKRGFRSIAPIGATNESLRRR
ncbi:MAG: hypothetical protein ACK52I_33370 [Pseudomonadota bacterium]